ncbi:hypothetical protein MKW98_009334 [Papaver atlanticum]|uniref:Uncharacterized protein n=1 Tax=Papaver atlanticum TaxID=357466 RepID=A0AAD4RZP4_9MAGN|nr:hypothetical protein MKW98_009334 [Papaver atlanticum]
MDGQGYSPIMLHFELFDAAYIENLNRFKRLALDHAKAEGIEVGKAIQKLVDEGSGESLLHAAATGGGYAPLHHAIYKGHLDIVRYLLEKGANADASSDGNYTPLHIVAKTGDTKIITLLLSRGVHIDGATRIGTSLQYAAGHGHRDAVKVLLDHGANPNPVIGQGMLRPLTTAILFESWECMELLLQAGANPSAESFGNTPLILAAKEEYVGVITRLLEAGADPNYKTNVGLTALEIAAMRCNYQIVGILFHVTSRIPTYPDWSIAGLMRHVHSDAYKTQREVYLKEKFQQAKSKGRDAFQEEQYLMAALDIYQKDPAVLSNMSACYARLGDGFNALEYATKCMNERPEWPKVYYRLGVALNILKRYGDAANAFNKGLTLDPRNKELKDAYMKAIEDRLNSIK